MGRQPNVQTLVGRAELCDMLGVADNALRRYIRYGWIQIECMGGYRGRVQLFRPLSPERVEEIHQLTKQRMLEGAKKGREEAIKSGGVLLSAARGRTIKSSLAENRRAMGLLNKRGVCEILGCHIQTLNYWISEGHIAPALISKNGQQCWFHAPDEALCAKLRTLPNCRLAKRAGNVVAGVQKRQPAAMKLAMAGPVATRRAQGLITRSEFARAVGVCLQILDRCEEQGIVAPVEQDAWAKWYAIPDEAMVERVRGVLRPSGRQLVTPKEERPMDDGTLLTHREFAGVLDVCPGTLDAFIRRGWIVREKAKRGKAYLFAPPTPERLAEIQTVAREHRSVVAKVNSGKGLAAKAPVVKVAKAEPAPRPKAEPKPPIQRVSRSAPKPIKVKAPRIPSPLPQTVDTYALAVSEGKRRWESEWRKSVFGFVLAQNTQTGIWEALPPGTSGGPELMARKLRIRERYAPQRSFGDTTWRVDAIDHR